VCDYGVYPAVVLDWASTVFPKIIGGVKMKEKAAERLASGMLSTFKWEILLDRVKREMNKGNTDSDHWAAFLWWVQGRHERACQREIDAFGGFKTSFLMRKEQLK